MTNWRRRLAKGRASGAATTPPRSAPMERRLEKLTLARAFQAPIRDDEKQTTELKPTEENDDEHSGESEKTEDFE